MQNKEKEKQQNRDRIKRRIRKVVSGTPERPRLVVFRANANISTQLVDDVNHKTLATVTSVAKKYDDIKQKSSGKIEISKKIGLDTAEFPETTPCGGKNRFSENWARGAFLVSKRIVIEAGPSMWVPVAIQPRSPA